MLKQVMTAPGKIEFIQTDMPKPLSGQVLVKIKKIGVCGSDIHVYHGLHPFTKYPVTQGHEVSAQIVSVGENVKDFKKGQRVTIQPQIVCGKCYPCTHGKYNLCEKLKVMGFQADGTASEYFAVDTEKLICLPDNMSYSEGAMIEPLAVCVHAVTRAGDISGRKIAVLGAGPIGILLAQCAKAMGAKEVLITDISDFRLQIAKECNINYTVNTKNISLNDAMLGCLGENKADVIFDCAGNDVSMGQAIKFARKGSTIILVAVYAGMAKVDLAVLNDHELDLNTSMMYKSDDYIQAIKLVNESKIKLKPLISKHFKFKDYLKAYEYIEQNKEQTMKVIIDVDASED